MGETVVVEYEGYIYADDPSAVKYPVSVSEYHISSDGEVAIPE